MSAEEFAESLGTSYVGMVGDRLTRANKMCQQASLVKGFDPYKTKKRQNLGQTDSSCGGGGGSSGGGGDVIVVDCEPEGSESAVVLTKRRRHSLNTSTGRGAGGGSGGSAGGRGSRDKHAITPSAAFVRCCCQRNDCIEDVSNSDHYCSVTGNRVNAWCLDGYSSEDHVDSKGPCVRCVLQVEEKA